MSTVVIGLADKEIPSNVKLSTLPGIFDCIFFKTLNTVESFQTVDKVGAGDNLQHHFSCLRAMGAL